MNVNYTEAPLLVGVLIAVGALGFVVFDQHRKAEQQFFDLRKESIILNVDAALADPPLKQVEPKEALVTFRACVVAAKEPAPLVSCYNDLALKAGRPDLLVMP